MATAHDPSEKRWLWAVREVDHLFGRLGRYTKFVMFGKWSLAIIALFLIVSLIAWPLITKDKSGLRISFIDKKTAGEAPTSPVMSSPVYRGTNVKGQQFQITGNSATQKTTNFVVIDKVTAQVLKANGKWNSVTADRADYQQDKQIADLYGNVTLIDDKDMMFTTSHATIVAEPLHITGNQPITGTGGMGDIVASGFEITDNGDRITFMGGGGKQVRVTVDRAKKNNE